MIPRFTGFTLGSTGLSFFPVRMSSSKFWRPLAVVGTRENVFAFGGGGGTPGGVGELEAADDTCEMASGGLGSSYS